MKKPIWILTAALLLAPLAAMAENIKGRLDYVSFVREVIEVDGVTYEVNTESTQVIYRGEEVGEESLSEGDEVVLILGKGKSENGKRPLEAVHIVKARKSGLDS